MGEALLGDFRQTLLVSRDDVKISQNEGDSSLFDYNLVKFRAEGRYGFAVLRPAAFIKVDVTEPEEYPPTDTGRCPAPERPRRTTHPTGAGQPFHRQPEVTPIPTITWPAHTAG